MKNNLILLVFALGLGVFTYYYQELGEREERAEKEKEEEILNFNALGEVRSFHLPHVKIKFEEGKYRLDPTGEEVDPNRVNKFLEQLSYIKVKRVLTPDEIKERKDFITNDELKMTFSFENGSATFTLGEQLSFSRNFYLEVEKNIKGEISKQLVIAFNSEVLDQVYAEEEAHRSDHQYRRFQSLYYLSKEFFRDHRIFGPWMDSQWSLQRIYIDNNRNIGYSLLLDKKTTNPIIPDFLSLNTEEVMKFEKEFALQEAKKIIPYDNEKLINKEKRLAMVIVSSTKGSIQYELYKEINSELKEHYIVFPDRKLLYEISNEQANLYLGSVQKFWNLKFWEKRPDSLRMKFNGEAFQLDIQSTDGIFKVKSDHKTPIHLEFQKLINFLGNKADYWISGEEVAQNYIKQFSLDWGKGEFFLMIRSGEILLYHSESKQGLVFKISGRFPFGAIESDYFL